MRYVVIMAGGSGTRLWPLSRKGTPKQLLKIVGGKSLLRIAFERALRVVPPENVLVVTGSAYVDQVAADLPEVASSNLLGEPVGRDSLNACAWPAAVLLERDPDAVIAQVTADHIIEPVDAFAAALTEAFEIAEENSDVLVTLGVVPTSPNSGYGYLERGAQLPGHPDACSVREFTEKPTLAVAARYVTSGEYWWNSGMFVWRAATFLDEVRAMEPGTHALITELAAHPDKLQEIFPTLKKNSVDYAIMEPATHGSGTARVVAVALPIDWRDVGGYASLAEILDHDADDNSVGGQVITLEARSNIVINEVGDQHLIAVLGVDGLVVVHTADATLVTTVDQAEKIKLLAAKIAEQAPTHA